MSRSVFLIVVLLAGVVLPLWMFDKAETPPASGYVPPATSSSPSSQPSIFSHASARNEVSPAILPSSSARGNWSEPMRSGALLPPSSTTFSSSSATQPSAIQPSSSSISVSPGSLPNTNNGLPSFPGLVQQFPPNALVSGSAQTLVFPGDQFGPDLSAGPMTFQPVFDLNEILRFDMTPAWVKQRWQRVSATTIGKEYRSLRVALVTGVNAWDLQGSLTYYFDQQQKLQRISFRGWTGDESQLLNILVGRFGFERQASNWAGVYIAQRERVFNRSVYGGILLKEPAVIHQENRNQRVALVLELNNPSGPLSLSKEFIGLYSQAVPSQ